MRWRLILATLLAVPLVELVILILVGQYAGIGWIVLVTLLTAILGIVVVRQEGRRSMRRLRETVDAGQLLNDRPSEGVLRMVGGLALLIPGFLTDLIGLLLLIPMVRSAVRQRLFRRFVEQVSPDAANQMFGPRRVRARRGPAGATTAADSATSQPDVIEGEVVEEDGGEPRPGREGTAE